MNMFTRKERFCWKI